MGLPRLLTVLALLVLQTRHGDSAVFSVSRHHIADRPTADDQSPDSGHPSDDDGDCSSPRGPADPGSRMTREAAVELMARIVGGNVTKPNDYPWQVGLGYHFGGSYFQIMCGGSLVSSEWVLTAAHCVYKARPVVSYSPTFKVLVGGYNLSDVDPANIYTPEVIIRHPGFDPKEMVNDIALVRLPSRVRSSRETSAVCQARRRPEAGAACYVTGWGFSEEGGMTSDLLQVVGARALPNSKCESTRKINPSMICAGEMRGGKDACKGDSGGPLVCVGPKGRLVQAGIVSFGTGCARPGLPGVYTDVAYFSQWMADTMRAHAHSTRHSHSHAHSHAH